MNPQTNFELIEEAQFLAKKYYGKNDSAFLWGCLSALLTAHQLQLIISILKEMENN